MTTRHITILAAALAALASAQAQAQTKAIDAAPTTRQLDPAKRIPPPPATNAPAQAPAYAPTPAYPQPATTDDAMASEATPAYGHGYDDLGGAFIGVHYGRGEVYDGVDQNAAMIGAGYRWQAGPIALLGVEVAAGKLDDTREDGYRYDKVDYASLGFNGRFNFGAGNPVFGLVRTGYWRADTDGENIDGGYFGLGLGVDFARNVNMSLVYTNHVYFDDYSYDDGDGFDDLNRADTLMLGLEARF